MKSQWLMMCVALSMFDLGACDKPSPEAMKLEAELEVVKLDAKTAFIELVRAKVELNIAERERGRLLMEVSSSATGADDRVRESLRNVEAARAKLDREKEEFRRIGKMFSDTKARLKCVETQSCQNAEQTTHHTSEVARDDVERLTNETEAVGNDTEEVISNLEAARRDLELMTQEPDPAPYEKICADDSESEEVKKACRDLKEARAKLPDALDRFGRSIHDLSHANERLRRTEGLLGGIQALESDSD